MTQLPTPPAFPQAGTRSKSLALGILTAAAILLAAGAVAVAKARAPRPAEAVLPPPSYEDAMRQAEAEDLAKGITPEMAAALRQKGHADLQAQAAPAAPAGGQL